jgi:alpha-methylacyl-CoA racemase
MDSRQLPLATGSPAAPPHSGVLSGVRVVEMAGLGPVSFAAMLLADMGAEVLRIERPQPGMKEAGATLRGRTVVTLDLRSPQGLEMARGFIGAADVLLEGFRPGVMERLGLGAEELLARHPKLVFGRMTGWGQDGPLAASAGHDINYVGVTGALHAMGGPQALPVPLNVVGDYGGGALYLAMGVIAALHAAERTGRGQVVDAAIVDGVVSMLSLVHGLRGIQRWQDHQQANVLDGGAPFYRTYRCRDGAFVAVGAIEPQFYAQWREHAGLSDPVFDAQHDRARWPEQHAIAERVFSSRTQAQWLAVFDGVDACVSAVRSLAQSADDPHLQARGAFVRVEGECQPAPAPRFSATPSQARASVHSSDPSQLLAHWQTARGPQAAQS